jgi:hypothetical protein
VFCTSLSCSQSFSPVELVTNSLRLHEEQLSDPGSSFFLTRRHIAPFLALMIVFHNLRRLWC